MFVFQAPGSVTQLRFLPDGRLLIGSGAGRGMEISGRLDICSPLGGDWISLPLPTNGQWHEPHQVAVPAAGDWCAVAWTSGIRRFRTRDGASLPMPASLKGSQVIVSPDGTRLVATQYEASRNEVSLTGITLEAETASVVWTRPFSAPWRNLAGFVADGERYITVDASRVRLYTFTTGDELATARYLTHNIFHPLLSPDGRYLGVIGYASMYVYDTTALGHPRRITSSSTFGNFVSFAFHPDGQNLAVIHGGPTLVKLYDLATLKLKHRYKWNLGPLTSVAFSPDGTLGAAGSSDGRIVVWDMDS